MRIISVLVFFLFLTGCSNNAKKNNKKKADKTEKERKASKSSEAKKIDATSFKESLNKKESRGLRAINKKYTSEINALKEQNKWIGDENKKMRKELLRKKENEIKELLGSKYEAYRADLQARKAKNK